jgi:hypothetical protein
MQNVQRTGGMTESLVTHFILDPVVVSLVKIQSESDE